MSSPIEKKPQPGDLTQLRLDSCGEILANSGNIRIQHKVVKSPFLGDTLRYDDDATIYYKGIPQNESTGTKVLWGIATVLTLGLAYVAKRGYHAVKYYGFADKVDKNNLDLIKGDNRDFIYKCTRKEIDRVANAWKKRERHNATLPTGLVTYIGKNMKNLVKNITYSSVDEQIRLLATHLTKYDTNIVQDMAGKKITPENIKKEMEVYRQARDTLVKEGYL